jgi:hypothetical protein
MPGYSSYDIVGAKEDVADIITNISPTKTPFQSLLSDEKVKTRLYEWQEDSLADVAVNAKVEGFTASVDTAVETVMRDNTTQILSKTAQVTGSNEAVDKYGRDKEMAYQLRKRSAELKRDLEHALVGTAQTKVTGDNNTARRFAGYQAMIDASVTETAPDGDTVTAGTQVSALTESMFKSAMQKLYNAGAEASIFMVKPADAGRIADWAYASGRSREFTATERKLVNVVDVLVTPWGEVKVVLNRWVKSTDALLFDPDMWRLAVLRPWFRETLAKTGDNMTVMLVGEYGLKHKNFKGSALITNLAA